MRTVLTAIWLLTLVIEVNAADTPTAADFDSLGGNKILLDRARALEPDKKLSVVQNRTVERRGRLELAPEFSSTFGGEAYLRTQSLALNSYYHFTPRFSAGLKVAYSFNDLTPEGEAMVDRAYEQFRDDPENPLMPYPELDYPKGEALALMNWFPIYGKINFLDQRVIHFDAYMVGGGGQVWLRSGPTATYTAGAGLGFWLSPQFSTRFEVRYQTYNVTYFNGEQRLDLAVGSLQMGWLL
jgi:outer membrane immunogenic protein